MFTDVETQAPKGIPMNYSSKVSDYRQDLRRYLRDLTWADEWRSTLFAPDEEGHESDSRVMARVFEDGWNRWGWPESVGGLGGDEAHRAVFYEELGYAMLPIPAQHWMLELLGPALLEFAPHLAATHLPGYLRGKEWWGLCFSEPESGGDLTSLTTRLQAGTAGGFALSGHKTWTSQGHDATHLLVLARTGAHDAGHHGLTMAMIDVDAPGVGIRPIATAGGRREFAEVSLENVQVSSDRVIGEVDAGWSIARFLLQDEHGMYGYAVLNKVLTKLGRLREGMVANGSTEAQRQAFGRVYVDVVAAQARTAKFVRRPADGVPAAVDGSVDKLLFGHAESTANDLILEIARERLIGGTDRAAATLHTARAEWWYSRATKVIGGPADGQRDIVADYLVAPSCDRDRQLDTSFPLHESIFRLFESLAVDSGRGVGPTNDQHARIGPQLAALGWSHAAAEDPVEACRLLFRAQGRFLVNTDSLDRVMLAEFVGLLEEPVDGIVLPAGAGYIPSHDCDRVTGIVLGSPRGRLIVPVSGSMGTVSIGIVNSHDLDAERMDTFDPSSFWTRVSGPLDARLVAASTEWNRAVAAAHRSLATELLALAEESLFIAAEHIRVPQRFGGTHSSMHSSRHALADCYTMLAAVRALLDESWRYGGRLSALTAKIAAGRAHRVVSDMALRTCGSIGLTADHDLHRYVARGFQVDSLCGSYSQLEAALGQRLFEIYSPGRALPSIVAWPE